MNIREHEEYKNIEFQHDLNRVYLCRDTDFESEKQAMIKLKKEYWVDYYRQNPEEMIVKTPEKYKNKHQDKMLEYFKARQKAGRYKYLFVTINPNGDTTIEQLAKCYNKYARKQWIDKIESCIEWTEEESDISNGNMHIHSKIWLSNTKDPYRCKQEIYNTFKRLCDYQCIGVQYGNRDDAFDKYLRGIKKGLKKECMPTTNHYRKIYNIPDIFNRKIKLNI